MVNECRHVMPSGLHCQPPAMRGAQARPHRRGLRDHHWPQRPRPLAHLRGLPPSLFITSGRDLLLSGTVNLHRAYLNAGVDARLVVFDALPRAFWYDPMRPEALEANHTMADFSVK